MQYVSLNQRTRERKRDRSTMAGFKWTKWIQMSVFLMLVLLFTAGAGQRCHFTVRDGDKVTLPCENRIKDQDKCNSTTWLHSDPYRSPAVELISHGKIHENAKDKSDRLSVTEDCSLVIEKVTVRDVGHYTCRQYKSGQQQGSDSGVHLSVINIHEDKVNMMLTCTVLTYDTQCRHTVQWLYEGKKDDFTITEKTPTSCSATVTFKAPHHNHKSKYEESFKCNVTDSDGQNLLVCNFTLQSSGDRTAEPNGNRTSPGQNDGPSLLLLYIAVPVGFAALLITVGAVIRQRRTKGNKTLRDENTGLTFDPAVTQSAPETSQDKADPEDGVFYTSISYARKADSKARVQGDDDEDDAVTYSTVKAPSSSAGASTDPSDFYATVNKPRT